VLRCRTDLPAPVLQPAPISTYIVERMLKWTIVIGFFALCLGIISFWITHLPKVMKQAQGWGFNAVALGGFLFMVLMGFVFGKSGKPFLWGYNNLMNPITSTMFGLLAFFIASAAYRAFRMRSLLATILLVSAVIVMLGRVPIGDFVLDKIVAPLGAHGLLGAAAELAAQLSQRRRQARARTSGSGSGRPRSRSRSSWASSAPTSAVSK
jgi:hypothetical protein